MIKIARLLAQGVGLGTVKRARIAVDLTDVVAYAVGDVHGCLDELLELERRIAVDAQRFSGRKLLIMLGDYVDRGPASSAVVSHLLDTPLEGFERICLLGNHEVAMLDYLDGRLGLAEWRRMGARQTLLSYGVDCEHIEAMGMSPARVHELARNAVPAAHVDFLRSLPILIESRSFLFVHAGIRPGVDIDRQTDEDLLFIRSGFLDSTEELPKWVVHGHTPIREVKAEGLRLNVDTGAYHTGQLTAVRIRGRRGAVLSNLTPLQRPAQSFMPASESCR